jgi:hypothetical protein
MDYGTFGINIALIAGIIAFTAVIKKMDSKGRLKRFYVFIPLALGIGAAFFMTRPLNWQGVGVNAFIYAGLASYIYVAGKKLTIGGVVIDPTGAEEPTSLDVKPSAAPPSAEALPDAPRAPGADQ